MVFRMRAAGKRRKNRNKEGSNEKRERASNEIFERLNRDEEGSVSPCGKPEGSEQLAPAIRPVISVRRARRWETIHGINFNETRSNCRARIPSIFANGVYGSDALLVNFIH